MEKNIYEALRESHEIQRSLFRRLMRATPEGGKRQSIFRELRIEMEAHEAAEERFLYAPILMDDMGLNSARHALAEHHDIDECVDEVGKVDVRDDGWYELVKKLSHLVHHHLREEETKFFQVSGKILSDAEKLKLAKKYEADYQRMKKKLAES